MKSLLKPTREEANEILTKMVQDAHKALSDCEKFADEHGLTFSFSHENSAFDDDYEGKKIVHDRYQRFYENKDELERDYPKGQWASSSIHC